MPDDPRLEGLRAAVELSPGNTALRLVLAEALEDSGLADEALDHRAVLVDTDALPDDELVETGTRALSRGRLQLAARCLDRARRRGVVGGTVDLERELQDALLEGGAARPAADQLADDDDEDELDEDDDDLDLDEDDEERPRGRRRRDEGPDVSRLVDPGADAVRFTDVGGLADVKKAVHRTIVLPYQRPELYAKYGRTAGGGVLLYGPPGVGKTLLARATAGECGVPFLNLRMEDVLDPMYGVSEKRLHAAFEDARHRAPAVLFLDELDAFAYARRKQRGSAGRALVDQLLQELDAIGAENAGLLVLAATNTPWDVDDALKRPGRFDRVVFVPPPDEEARRAILELALRERPQAGLDLARVAKRTPLFSGADLVALVERATDAAIEETLDRGGDAEVPISSAHVEQALAAARPTTVDWLRTARNYVEFANDGGRYDDVEAYLDRRDVKGLLKRASKEEKG